ncbi:LacI family DNA-binding transcriptional regulator [Frondihabitans sp. PAMC 28766]|uniref:LacI family DNA-binding transcriptional regulator n=1 Tax=Frondihabitans sp. PAMC 28766 TaxID=1795630 RepID=UPI0012FF9A5A|nr:LacI family DNA-binding transcriptional regulator [Frondihabitans sp. PAMC 28766]
MQGQLSHSPGQGPIGASMEDVAEAAGVSISTVSRALRNASNVRPETTARVHDAAARLGFSASPSAASLATGKVKRIAVLIGSPLTDWFSGTILDGIYREVRSAGYDLLLYRVHDADERRVFFETLPARRNADALLVASFALTPDEQATLERMRVPVVYLNQKVSGSAGVGIDDRGAGRAATEYALGLGRRRVVFLRERGLEGFRWSARDRYRGYLDALDAAGLSASAELVEEPGGGRFGVSAADRILAGAVPVVVACESDGIAIRLLAALRRRGARVPDDVAVIGFDGQPEGELFGLTTVVQPVAEMTGWAARTAVALARDANAPRERLELPTVLRLGTTTPR